MTRPPADVRGQGTGDEAPRTSAWEATSEHVIIIIIMIIIILLLLLSLLLLLLLLLLF